jgi:hypothetical protein
MQLLAARKEEAEMKPLASCRNFPPVDGNVGR